MSIPETLQHKMELFQTQGRLLSEADELFAQGSWFQVMHGQGLAAARLQRDRRCHRARRTSATSSKACVVHQAIASSYMPTHEEFIEKNCKATAPVS